MNNELTLKKQHQRQQRKLVELEDHYAYINKLMRFSHYTTFLLYLAFAISLYLGDFMNMRAFFEMAAGSVLGFLFYGVVCGLLAYTLSGIKHAAYSHMAMFGRAFTIIGLVIFMGLMAEVFQSGAQQDAKAKTAAEHSPEYQALLKQTTAPALPADAGLTLMIAQAKQVLARCEQNLKAGKEPHCEGDRAKLQALQDQVQAQQAHQLEVSTAQIEARSARLDELQDKSHNPTVRAIADYFDWDDVTRGIVFMMFIVAVCFELSHYYLSEMKRQALQELDRLSGTLDMIEIDYNQQTGQDFHNPAPEAAQAPQQPPEEKTKSSSIGFNQPATAQTQPLFKYQEREQSPAPKKQAVGFWDTNGKKPLEVKAKAAPSKHDQEKPSIQNKLSDPSKKDVLGSHETQLDLQTFIDALPDPEQPQYERYLDKSIQTGKANSEDEVKRFLGEVGKPKNTFPGADENTSQSVRVQSDESVRVHPKHLKNTSLNQELLQAMTAAKNKLSAKVLREALQLYPEWKKQVEEGVIQPSVRPAKELINARLCGGGRTETTAPKGMQALHKLWALKAVQEGLLKINPEHSRGKSLYLLNRKKA